MDDVTLLKIRETFLAEIVQLGGPEVITVKYIDCWHAIACHGAPDLRTVFSHTHLQMSWRSTI